MVETRILLPSGEAGLWSLLFVFISIVMKVCPACSPVDLYPAPGPPESLCGGEVKAVTGPRGWVYCMLAGWGVAVN